MWGCYICEMKIVVLMIMTPCDVRYVTIVSEEYLSFMKMEGRMFL
jgi:hypothetical protein